MIIAEAKSTEIFCVIDEFNQNFEKEMSNHALISSSGKRRRNRKDVLSESEIMTILVLFHLNHCRDLKHFYLHEICIHLRHDFPQVVSIRGYISQNLFDTLFADGVNLVTGLRGKLKNKRIPLGDKIRLPKRYIIESMNDRLKNTAQLVPSRHRSINNFIINLVSVITAYCFFDNKPQALSGYEILKTNQPSFF